MKDSDSFKPAQRIPREELTAYERWELPVLDEQGNEVPPTEEEEVRPLTAADLEAIRQAAHEEGYREGREAGFREGQAEGREAGHKEGLEAGLAEGREQGRQEAFAQTRAELDERLARLEQLMGELLQPVRRHQEAVADSLTGLVTTLARVVVKRELQLDSSVIRRVVREALDSLPPEAENIRIHVHPDDLEPVHEIAGTLEAAATVVADPQLTPGGCRVETRHSRVDFSVEERFRQAVRNMLGAEGETASVQMQEAGGDGDYDFASG